MTKNLEIGIRFGTVEGFIKGGKEVRVKAEAIPRILSGERIRLLGEINGKDNISEISHRLNRRIEHVSRDLALLKEHGIIRFERKGREKIPAVIDHEMVIRI
ncbi:MAG: hypothetical protein KKE96_01010 [Candidatus Altiarchaeota archaeon]|nr:hypothetical protein [Candidatus Altiarchaeota archaeon]MBU4341220.1 hypothetical protein [Candidatus Altiarchaeota archaeon]MBU4436809.1 hypothetical protein [Candidatus Altiarchaeota archaeon]